MRKLLAPLLAATALMIAVLCLPACSGLSGKAADVASVAAQASGAVSGLVDVAMAAPVDDATRDKIAVYGRWAKLGTEAAAGLSTALAAPDAAQQAQGAVTAINTLVQQAPLDASTKTDVSNWSNWALLALRAAATLAPLVLGDASPAGTLHALVL